MERFPRSEQGLAGFREFLALHPGRPVFMLVDAVDEDYRLETLPHCSGAERKQMVARKLKQHYRNTPYVGAWLQSRESGKRRDDRYLFSALTNPDLVDEWLRVVHDQRLPVAGVYLLPMVSAGLLDTLRMKTPNVLLATQHTGGLRLTFFRDGQFRLSRFTREDPSKSTDLTRLFLGEISNTRLYLHALHTVTLDEHLTVLLIDSNDELEHVADAIVEENPALECIRAGRADLCAKLSVSAEHLAWHRDALYLQLLGLHPRAGNIAPAAATRRYGRYQARRTVFATCAAMASVAMLWSTMNAWTAHGVHTQAEEVAARIKTEDARHRQVTRQFPPTPVSGEAMRRAVEVSSALKGNARDPHPMMAAISSALQSSPDIVLREFGWTYSVAEIQKGQEPSAPSAATTPPGAMPPGRRQSAYIQGEIRSFRGDYRAAMASIDAFAQRLRQNPHVAEVRTIKMPLNVNPNAILSGNTLDSGREPATAEFELLIVYKPRA